MENFEYLKVGDVVWTIQTGYGNVTSITSGINYPITVNEWASYTTDGKFGCRDEFKSLYAEAPFTEIFKPRWMMVCDFVDRWKKRFVIAKYNDRFVAIEGANTEEKLKDNYAIICWKYAKKLPNKRKITMQEIADKFGEDIDNIEIE